MAWFAYIVECADGSLYSGITTNIERRVAEHNDSKKGAKYTKTRRPVCIRFQQRFKSRSAASKREWQLKQLSRIEKLALLKGK